MSGSPNSGATAISRSALATLLAPIVKRKCCEPSVSSCTCCGTPGSSMMVPPPAESRELARSMKVALASAATPT